jgi:methyltransferase
MVTHILFLLVLALIGVQRVLELVKSHRQVKALIARGGKEHSSRHYAAMVLVHALWFVSMIVEVFLVGSTFLCTYPQWKFVALLIDESPR